MRALALGRTYALAAFVLLGLAVALLATPLRDRRDRRRRRAAASAARPARAASARRLRRSPRRCRPRSSRATASRRSRPPQRPQPVKDAIYAANRIVGKPYRYGGGHRRFNDSGYDCSGSVSYALRGGGLVKAPAALDARS